MISPEQCRAARGLLGWSQGELASRADVSRQSVAHFEGGGTLGINNIAGLRQAFEDAGVEFIEENGGGAGLRFREPGGKGA